MSDRWMATPLFFERPEPILATIAPDGRRMNEGRPADRNGPELAKSHAPIRAFVEETIAAGDRPISLAGDCCASMPVLAGLQATGVAPTLVWLDAHGDFNTPETSPSQFLGGMPLAMMVGRGPQWLCETNGVTPIPEDRIVLVDGRDLDPLEREAVDASGLRQIPTDALADLRVDGPVHLHVDLDIVSSDAFPGFSYPAPGGPGPEAVKAAIEAFAATADVRAVSISGWTDALDPERAGPAMFGDVLATFGAVRPNG